YVAIRKLHPALQNSVAKFAAQGDISFAPRSNYWCAFLAACLRVLANHGSLAFVLPAAWDYAQYAADVRRIVHEKFHTVEVHRSHEPLFTDVREGCVVLVARGYQKKPISTVRVAHRSAKALITGLTKTARPKTVTKVAVKDGAALLTPMSDLYTINIGCVTGDA